jgi:hypothetical protein
MISWTPRDSATVQYLRGYTFCFSAMVGFPPKLISSEFRLSTVLMVEIIESNLNFDFDCRNRNFDEITMYFRQNFDFVESKQSKSKFRFRHRNRNFGKSKHRNSDEIRIKFRRNFDFVESIKTTFVETLTMDSEYRAQPRHGYILCEFFEIRKTGLTTGASHRNQTISRKGAYCI